MYAKILAPLDGSEVSELVLPYAQSLAESLSLPVTLLYATEPGHITIPQSLNPSRHGEELAAHRLQHAREYAESKAAGLRGAGLRVDIATPVEEPAPAIVVEASKNPATLIAMSSHGRSGLARWWMGSVTDKVLHLTDNPMLIIRARVGQAAAGRQRFERITVPVDGSELAEEILPHAVYLSQAMGLTIDLARVNPSAEEYYRSMAVGPAEAMRAVPSYEEYIAAVDGEAEGYLAELKGRLLAQGAAAAVDTLLRHGKAADSIADLAAATDNNLVAMTTHGRSGVGRLVLGSVAERVVRQSGDPVLLVRGGQERPAARAGAPALA